MSLWISWEGYYKFEGSDLDSVVSNISWNSCKSSISSGIDNSYYSSRALSEEQSIILSSKIVIDDFKSVSCCFGSV